jgi:long-subunit acyl-CoA synthetase (AMP-forming)
VNATLADLLRAQAARKPDGPALYQKRRGIWVGRTWAQYAADVQAFAGSLSASGFGPGSRLLLIGEASAEWLIAEAAAHWLGGATVTPYPDAPAAELADMIGQSAFDAVVVDGMDLARAVHLATGADPAGFVLLRPEAGAVGDTFDAALRAGRAAPARSSPGLATIVFTPGAGGRCRPIALDHATLITKAEALAAALKLGDDDLRALAQVPPAHVAERIATATLHLRHGGTLFFPERVDTVGGDIEEAKPAQLSALPWQVDGLHRALVARLPAGAQAATTGWFARRALRRHLGLSSVRRLVIHGGAASAEAERFFHQLDLDVVTGYGITEGAGWSLVRHAGQAWTPLAGSAATDIGGELVLEEGGRRLATGDRAAQGGPAGRLDASEIETRLQASPLIARAVIVGGIAAIEADARAAGAWATAQGHGYTTYRSLVTLPAVADRLRAEAAERAGIALGGLVVLAEPLARADGTLTASATIRRDAVAALIHAHERA